VPLPDGLAVTRGALDAALADEAVRAGAVLQTETLALVIDEHEEPSIEGWRHVALQPRNGAPTTVRARVILASDGLSHGSLRECVSMRSLLDPRARVGVGGVLPPGSLKAAPGTITMAIARHGYVGVVEVEGGAINVAAAMDPGFLKTHAGAAAAVAALLAEAGVASDRRLSAAEWNGTIPLTRRLPVPAARRLFVLGDAAGYVEPFTGEGMAWALAAAEAVVPLTLRAVEEWREAMAAEWVAEYARRVGREQRWCRAIAGGLRRPRLASAVVGLLARQPGLARPIVSHLRPRMPRA